MTAGAKSWDRRVMTFDGFGNPFLYGDYGYINWSGGDATPGVPSSYLEPHGYQKSARHRIGGRVRCLQVNLNGEVIYDGFNQLSAIALRSDATNPTILSLHAKLADKMTSSGYNLLMSAGELGKTTDMLFGRLRQTANFAREIRRGNLTNALAVLGNVSPKRRVGLRPDDAWAEARWGWRPLASDIFALSSIIQRGIRPNTFVTTASGDWLKYHFQSTIPQLNHLLKGDGRWSQRIVATQVLDGWDVPLALGLLDPATFVWDALPFSFVADWVFPIGKWLAANRLQYLCNTTFVTTTRDYYKASFDGGSADFMSGTTSVQYSGADFATSYLEFQRVVSNSLTTPFPEARSPIPHGTKDQNLRVLDALALISQWALNRPRGPTKAGNHGITWY